MARTVDSKELSGDQGSLQGRTSPEHWIGHRGDHIRRGVHVGPADPSGEKNGKAGGADTFAGEGEDR